MSLESSRFLDSILVNDYIYSIMEWNNHTEINGFDFSSDMGHVIANMSENNISLMLMKIDKTTSDIIDVKPILYEFSGSTNTGITNVKIDINYNKTKLNILINNICGNEDTVIIYGNSGLTNYYSGTTNTYNGTTYIEQEINYKVGYVQFSNSLYNVIMYIQNRPKPNTTLNIGDYVTLKNIGIFDGYHQIKDIWFDSNGNVGAIYLSISQSKYKIYDENGTLITYYQWRNIGEIIIDDKKIDKYSYNVTNYESSDTIEITSIIDSIDKTEILGRYKDYNGLSATTDYSCFISGTTTKYIKQTPSSSSNKTGPIISELVKDEFENYYTFGQGSNFNGITDIQVGVFSPINPPIIKTNNNLAIISKFNKEGVVIWNNTITLSPDSIFDNPKILYSETELYLSFNFSGDVIISGKTYSTGSNQIINSVGFKINSNTGEIIKSKFLSSNIFNSIRDMKIYNEYIYFLGNMKGESHFDLITKFSKGDSGYIMKSRKKDGIIINIIDFYSDDTLNLKSLNLDDDNIFISGSYKGNIYINNEIKYSNDEEYFITNIKKNDL